MLKDHLAEATRLFRSGVNCSQAVFAVFSEDYGLPAETAMKLAYPFGRGMGGCGRTCGALTGAMMVIGMKYGAARPDETDNMKFAREKTLRLIEIFENEHGTTLCNDLTGLDQRKLSGPELMAMQPHFYNTCPKFLETVITYLEEEI